MRFPWLFIIGLTFWFMVAFSGSSKSAEGAGFLVPMTPYWKKSVESIGYLKFCGNYFAVDESEGTEIIHFIYEQRAPKRLAPMPIYMTMNFLEVLPDREVTTPPIITEENGPASQFSIRMSMEDYKTSLPCIGKGERV